MSPLPRSQFFHEIMLFVIRRDGYPLLIGSGIEIVASTLGTHAGYGAFVTEPVCEGNVVTVYDGWLIPRALVPRPGEPRDRELWQHCMAMKATDYVVLGLRYPIIGRGAGSFVNHCAGHANVAVRVIANTFAWDYFGDTAMTNAIDGKMPVLVVVALRSIEAGEELFMKYPSGACAWLGIDRDSTPTTTSDNE